uniref:SFRICE_011897 n=1 Tax=Spodoptera frugiperda TaxID=7108 RepID=A0A2H1VQV7_SPOFR
MPPKPVMYYWKPGSRCEVGMWRGCLPNINMFKDEYECVSTCIFSVRAAPSDYHEFNEIDMDTETTTDFAFENVTDANCTDTNSTDTNSTDTSNSTDTNSTDAGADATTTGNEGGDATTAAAGDGDGNTGGGNEDPPATTEEPGR